MNCLHSIASCIDKLIDENFFLRVPRQFKFRLFPGGDPLDFCKFPDGIGVIIDQLSFHALTPYAPAIVAVSAVMAPRAGMVSRGKL